MNPNYRDVARRAEHRCEYCRAPEVIFNLAFEVEHIVPKSQLGSNELSNLALACRCCNICKSAFVSATDESTQSVTVLFHPRKDRWDDHFSLDLASGIIVGITAVGRATVSQLQMNRPTQLEARRQWMRLELFP